MKRPPNSLILQRWFLVLTILTTLGCSNDKSLVEGKYESVEGDGLVVYRGGQLDLRTSVLTLAGTYSVLEDGKIRIILKGEIDRVIYGLPKDNGAIVIVLPDENDDDTVTFYPIDDVADIRETHYCGLLQRQAELVESTTAEKGTSILPGVERKVVEVNFEWHASLYSHEECPKQYLWRSEGFEKTQGEFLSQEQAENNFQLLQAEASARRDEIAAEASARRDEIAAEAAEKAANEWEAEIKKAASPGEYIYNRKCIACHRAGALGAPKLGDADAWKPRIAKGNKALYESAINGLYNMPAMGFCKDCNDNEIRAAVDYLVNSVR